MQKLDIFGKKSFFTTTLGIYCKLRCNVISLATLAQWHREWKEVWKQEVTSFGRTASNFEKERLRVFRGPICPQISPKWKIISAKTVRNLPKLRESCALWQKVGGCAKARKLRSATSQFSGGTTQLTWGQDILPENSLYVWQESCAIAKMTAQCTLYMGALKNFVTPWLCPRLLFPTFFTGFCTDRPSECSYQIWSP